MRAVLALMPVVALGVGCGTIGGSSSDSPDGAPAPADPDAGGGGHGQARAVIVPLNGGDDPDAVAVLTLHDDGLLLDGGLRLPAPAPGRAVTFSPDGREALIPYGATPTQAKGVLVVLVEPDGSSAEIIQDLPITAENSPTDILFTGANEAIVGMRGPDPDFLQTVRRAGVDWEIGPAKPIGEGPLELHALDDGHGLLLRTDFIGTDGSKALPIARQDDGSWDLEASGVDFGSDDVIALAMTPGGDRAYATASSPSPSLLTLLGDVGTHTWTQGTPVALEPYGSLVGMSREGDVAVVFAFVADHYEIVTFDIGPDGTPSPASGDRTSIESGTIDDFTFGPDGKLLVLHNAGTQRALTSYRREGATSSLWHQIGQISLTTAGGTVEVGPTL